MTPEGCEEAAVEHLHAAVKTMRDKLDDLERVLKKGNRDASNKLQCAIHDFAWGFANASTSIERAGQL